MNTKLKELEKVVGQGKMRVNEPMSAHTTFKIGGPAEYYVNVDNKETLIALVKTANTLSLPVFILGSGSNIIVSEKGIKGLVIKNNCRTFETIDAKRCLVYTEAGAVMGQLVRHCIDQDFCGLEYQLGLPGTVGGAVFMNSNFPKKGAYVGDCVHKATLLTRDGKVKEVDNTYFQFAYDYSILQKTHEIVLSVVFSFTKEERKVLLARSNEALQHRLNTQPKGLSAGCTFRNISIVEAKHVLTPNAITSAGYLIDKAGLKGTRVGGAMISPMHANFVMNTGNATASDVHALLNLVKKRVRNQFGVQLHLEVREIGF